MEELCLNLVCGFEYLLDQWKTGNHISMWAEYVYLDGYGNQLACTKISFN